MINNAIIMSDKLNISKLSIVSPAYNEEEVLPKFIDIISQKLYNLQSEKRIRDWEVLIVDDGSQDSTWDIVKAYFFKDNHIKGIKLSRNFGQHNAITAGLNYVTGDLIIVMDCDLQADPEDICKVLEEYTRGAHVIWGTATYRKDPLLIRLSSKIFYKLFKLLAGIDVPEDIVFVALSRKALELFKRYKERRRLLMGLYATIGLKQVSVPVTKHKRHSGKPKYNLKKRIQLALTGLLSYSKVFLRASTMLGFLMSFSAISVGLFMFFKKLIIGISVPGYASLIVSVTILSGIQLIVLGILGEYLGVILDEVKARPIYLVEEELL